MRLLYKTTGILLFFFFFKSGIAQQTSINNLYYQNYILYNPAATGNELEPVAYLNVRNQWAGFYGAPNTSYFGVHVRMYEKMGIGAMFSSDKAGIQDRISGHLAYSYRVKFSETSNLSFGVDAGFESYTIKGDIKTEVSEPNLINDHKGKSAGAGFGLQYSWDNRLTIDFAAPQLFENNYDFKKHLVAAVAYRFDSLVTNMSFEPSILMRSLPYSSPMFDINVVGNWKNFFWGGLTYRTNSSMIFSGGVNVGNLSFGYGYEMSFNDKVQEFKGATFEIMVNYHFRKVKPAKVIEVAPVVENTEVNQSNTANQSNANEQIQAVTESYQKRIAALQREISDLNRYNDSVSHAPKSDSTLVYHQGQLESGNYVIINQFSELKDAKETVVKMRENRMRGYVLYNKSKKSYYIYTEMYKQLDAALKEMEKFRKKGFKSWVLVY